MRTVLLLVALGFSSAACLHTETLIRRDERIIETKTQAVQLGPRYEASAAFVGDDLALTATKSAACRDETVESVVTIEVWQKKLPPAHWAILASGVALLGGGIASSLHGDYLKSERQLTPLGSPAVEQSIDTGYVLFNSGIGAAVGGGALLGWDLVNLFSSGTREKSSVPSPRTSAKATRICARSGAATASVVLADDSVPPVTLSSTTDAGGRVVFPRRELERVFRATWASRSTPPSLSASVEGTPAAELGDMCRAGIMSLFTAWAGQARQQAEAASTIAAEALLADAQRAWKAARGADALARIDECLVKVSGHKGCAELRQSVAPSEARRHFAAAKKLNALQKSLDAQVEIQKCLALDVTNSDCLMLRPIVEAGVASTLEAESKKAAEADRAALRAALAKRLGPDFATLAQFVEEPESGFKRLRNKNPAEDAWKRVFTQETTGLSVVIEGPEEAPTTVGVIAPEDLGEMSRLVTIAVVGNYLKVLMPDASSATIVEATNWVFDQWSKTVVATRRFGRIRVSVKSPKVMRQPVALVQFEAEAAAR